MIALTAAIIGLLGLIPGMPNLVFIILATGLGVLAWKLDQRSRQAKPVPVTVAPTPTAETQEASWADVATLDVLGLEVGYRLIPLGG